MQQYLEWLNKSPRNSGSYLLTAKRFNRREEHFIYVAYFDEKSKKWYELNPEGKQGSEISNDIDFVSYAEVAPDRS